MSIVYWPITAKFRICKQTLKPQINYRCCLRFNYLAAYWIISRNTITFHKYFWCSQFCEFHSKTQLNLPIIDSALPPGQPTVDRAGPLLPALDTNITLCLSTSSFINSITRLGKKCTLHKYVSFKQGQIIWERRK